MLLVQSVAACKSVHALLIEKVQLRAFDVTNVSQPHTCHAERLIYFANCPYFIIYTSIPGSVYYYTILHLSILWLSHVFILFWKIKFPFHARHCEKKRTTHVLVVLLAVFIPTIPVIMSFLTGGFTIGSHPPSFCVSKNSDVAYYTLALPMSIIGATGVSLIFVVLLTVIKVNSFYMEILSDTV